MISEQGEKMMIGNLFRATLLLVTLLAYQSVFAQSKTVTYYYTDTQGTPLAEADAAGNIIATLDYRPLGGVALGAGSDGVGYTGHVNDADSGLIYMQQRYYSPEIGRFLNVDPVTVAASGGKSFNRYTYGENNSYRYTDPDGRTVSCTQDSCYVNSHSVVEMVADHLTVDVLIAQRLFANATASQQVQQSDAAPPGGPLVDSSSTGTGAPALPGELVGDSPRATGKNGGTAVGTSLPAGKFADTVKDLTGGSLGQPDSKGRSVSPNGVSVRTGGKSGPRIDIPANDTKPPEIIHFPEDTPIPDHLKPTP
jgi:RHS repeat-associated protein